MKIKQCGCGAEMEEGILNVNGTVWVSKSSANLVNPFRGLSKIFSGNDAKLIIAYKCKSCGKIDLYSENK